MKRGKFFITTLLIITVLLAALPARAASRDELVNKLISVAQSEVGYEGTSTYSKYGEWYGYQGGWCTTFALWCFNKTGEAYGVSLYANIVPGGGNCNSMISWFKNRGRYHTRSSGYKPKKGDLVFFDWSGNGSAQHVGILKSVSDGTVYTIEGNCSGKVKAKSYNSSSNSVYASVNSILGYGNPDWAAVTGNQTTKATTTTKKQTTTTTTTTKPATTAQTTTAETATTESTTSTTTTTTTTTITTTTTTAAPVPLKDMKIHASNTALEIGDSVKLDYEVSPVNASAVVGYFCDEEGVIEISDTGVITATGEGTATVVVCANDTIYRQCDFTVSAAQAQVTRHTPQTVETTQGTVKSKKQRLSELGINVEKLKAHFGYYKYPFALICTTAAAVLIISLIKRCKKTEN